MSGAIELPEGQRQFIERVGLYFEQYQLPRIGGRLLGLMMIANDDLGLDEMATALGVSRASISTNIRQLVSYGLAERVSLPGDRRDYYRFADNPWQHAMEARVESNRALRRIVVQGLAALDPGDTVARAHLEEAIRACDFGIEEMLATIARWQARRAASSDHRPHDNQSRLIADT